MVAATGATTAGTARGIAGTAAGTGATTAGTARGIAGTAAVTGAAATGAAATVGHAGFQDLRIAVSAMNMCK